MHPIRTLSLYEFLASLGLGLTATTSTRLQLQVGMTVSDIALVNVIFWLTIILLELPTSMLADGRSHVWSIRIGIALYAIGCFVYAGVQGVGTALIAEIVLGVGGALVSGAEEAWITEALKKRGELRLLSRAFGSQAVAMSCGMLIGGLIGVWVGTFDLRDAWIGGGIILTGSVAVAWLVMGDDGDVEERPTELEALRLSFQALRRAPALVWAAAATMLFGMVVTFNHLWQPFFVGKGGPRLLGEVWVLIQASTIVAGMSVRRASGRLFRGASGIVTALLLCGVGLVGISVFAGLPAILVCLTVHEFGRGLVRPMVSAFTQSRVEGRFRATVSSLQALLGKTGMALALALVWILSDGKDSSRETIVFLWCVVGCLLILGTFTLWKFRHRAE